MDKIGIIDYRSNFKSVLDTKLHFQKGEIIQAEVLKNTETGLLLQIGNSIIQAQTDFHFPSGTQIFLSVVGQNDRQIILSLTNELKNLDISKLLKDQKPEDSPEIRLIVAKLLEKKIKISAEKIELLKYRINKLPLNNYDALKLLTDPSLILGIFNLFDKESGFSLLLNDIKDEDSKNSYLEINILYQSTNLADILINIEWREHINIQLTCSKKSTYLLFKEKQHLLKKQIENLGNFKVEIKIILDKNIIEHLESNAGEKRPLISVDVRI